MNLRETMIDYGMRFVGKPYIYGGSGVSGADCSGLAQEMLMAVGLDPRGDQTANQLFVALKAKAVHAPDIGVLACFGSANYISHVGVCIGGGLMLEAAGGDKTTLSEEDAEKRQGAMVRIRPIKSRRDFVCYIDPFFGLEG